MSNMKEAIEKKFDFSFDAAIFEAFKQTWINYPSQDNEGYQPERGSYKAGFFEGVRWQHAQLKSELLPILVEMAEALESVGPDRFPYDIGSEYERDKVQQTLKMLKKWSEE